MEVFMNYLTLLSEIEHGEGFGFNGNILETNLLNLAVVIGVVVSFGGDALRSLLENRKQTILNNLQEAQDRANEAQEKLNKAKEQLELAKTKASEIRQQGLVAIEKEKEKCIEKAEQDAMLLETKKQETIRFQQQKIINQISQKVIFLSLKQVRERLQNRVDFAFHSSINNFNIALFTKYKP
uniref:ATP synthase subunit b, chloroplastic n=2 Tax=Ignatiaceae TaxID=2682551 RepID=A0A1W6EGN6_9CHLO|nr:CF0 subunit I of ATP synthase [Pseudocharacium americanum]YP_009367657.1 CF0 subunit I of ATP synthase [Ignatius tetrasporus]ARK14553.1 CF0 subunit I of ATP synthase [Pseudocharacium americanum]ARK14642.1 CF0 subunit I of ATP synthase [Ignatius tetrasporus]